MKAARRRYALDGSVRRSAGGRLLSGGAPARQVRLSAAGAAALDDLLRGGVADGAAAALRDRLLDAGLLHPLAAAGAGEPPPLTSVVPVRDGGRELPSLVAALRAFGAVIVVDDGSRDGSPQGAAAAGARVLANAGRAGPAGARNTGLAAATTPVVAFLDADCASRGAWAPALAALCAEDPALALAAPRVRSAPGSGAIARYERGHSPLDMGARGGLVGPGRRLGFLPATALVCRREALLQVGGFDERLRYGEDVDLVLRLLAAGWRVRYCPELEVEHRPRASLAALARQRRRYGGSAAQLDRRHPGGVAPARLNPHTAAVWAAAACGPRAALAAAAGSTAWAARAGSDAAARRALAAVVLGAHLESLAQLARLAVRDWLPLTLAAAAASAPARRRLALALLVDCLASRRRDGERLPLPLRLGLRALDDAAYSLGLWEGILADRRPGAALPAWRRARTEAAPPAEAAPGPVRDAVDDRQRDGQIECDR